MSLHPIVRFAAGGELPGWSVAGEARRAHMARVVGVLEGWAEALALSGDERIRWRAAGYLHDVLRDAPADDLVLDAPDGLEASSDPMLLHGPAAAERLRQDGVEDVSLLRAVAHHTAGHPDLDGLGRALYAADFLEPGRAERADWRADLRNRYPLEPDEVLLEVARARICVLLEAGRALTDETRRFWNSLVEG